MFLEARERRDVHLSRRVAAPAHVSPGGGEGGRVSESEDNSVAGSYSAHSLGAGLSSSALHVGAVCVRRDLAACALRASPARSPSLVSLSTPAGLRVAPDSCGGDNLGSPRSPQTRVGRRVLAVVALGSISLHRAGVSPATLGLIPVARMGSGAGLKAGPLVKTWGPLSEGKEETAARPRQPASSTSGRAVASLLPSAGVRVTHVRPLCEMSSS